MKSWISNSDNWISEVIAVAFLAVLIAVGAYFDVLGDDDTEAKSPDQIELQLDVNAQSISAEVIEEGEFIHNGQPVAYSLITVNGAVHCVVVTNANMGEQQPSISCLDGLAQEKSGEIDESRQ